MTGQVEQNGTSVIDVTDATRPVYLAHISGAPGGSEGGGAPRANAVVRRRPRRLVSLSGTRTSAG